MPQFIHVPHEIISLNNHHQQHKYIMQYKHSRGAQIVLLVSMMETSVSLTPGHGPLASCTLMCWWKLIRCVSALRERDGSGVTPAGHGRLQLSDPADVWIWTSASDVWRSSWSRVPGLVCQPQEDQVTV